MIGKSISHYTILDKLGSGGMGEVYLADDTKLERRVALKFLPAALSEDAEARQRLVREAKSASKLTHPNIVTIYAVESMSGRDFIVMEYVEGQDLSEYLSKRSPSLDDKLALAIQIAEGLGKAHAASVFHRDVKPSNILIDADGRAKLLDFGLATFQGATRLTQTGTTIGTAAYMSPEQASGRESDHRSDLFSFGVLLYEMIAGRLPFQGNHSAALMYAIMNEDPQPLARYTTGASDDLQRVVSKCLAKSVGERYQSASDLIADLRRLIRASATSGAPAIQSRKRMLAVLPFENLGPAEDEYFADGITEEIISRLASVKDIGVISRTSVMQFKGTKKAIREIGADLGVDYILEGTVRWGKSAQGARVRITPQLIRVSEDTHMWSDRYDRVIEDIFDVQSDIAEKVTEQLNIQLGERERRTLEAKPTDNVDAYHAFLRGLDYLGRADFTQETIRLSVQMFENAVSLDPQFAQAHAHLSIAHGNMYWYGVDRTPSRAHMSKTSAETARALRRDDADTPMAWGFYRYRCESDFAGALTDFQRSIELRPNYSIPLFMIAMSHRRLGNFKESFEASVRVLALDPCRSMFFTETALTAICMRRFEEAERLLDLSIAQQHDQMQAYYWKSHLKICGFGSVAEGRRILALAKPKPDAESFVEWFEVLLAERDLNAALTLIQGVPGDLFEEQYWYCPKRFLVAELHSMLGRENEALDDYQASAPVYESALREAPDDPRKLIGLAMTLRGLGQVKAAFEHAQAAIDARSIRGDSLAKPLFQWLQATVHARAGDHKTALKMIEYSLSIPGGLSAGHLRVMPYWDKLRHLPEFERLLNLPPKVF